MTPTPNPNKDAIALCPGCNTAKHLGPTGLCGRCEPDTAIAEAREILRTYKSGFEDQEFGDALNEDMAVSCIEALIDSEATKRVEERVAYELDRTLQDCIWADDIEHLKKMLANRITAQPQQQAMKGESDVN